MKQQEQHFENWKTQIAERTLRTGDLGGQSVKDALHYIKCAGHYKEDSITEIITEAFINANDFEDVKIDLEHAIEMLTRAKTEVSNHL